MAVPATLLRFRGFVQAAFDATVQVADILELTFALGIVSTDAFTAGSGSVPDPGGEPEYPWIWWQNIRLDATSVQASSTVQTPWGPGAMRLEVDSKAMRRIKPGQSVCWVVQSRAQAGAPVVNIHMGQTRVLIGT